MDLTEKRRVHEIARDEGLPSSLVLQRLQRAGLPIKTASSTIVVGEALHLLNPNRYPKPDTLDATLAAAAEAKAAPKKRAKEAADAAAAAAAAAAALPKPKRVRRRPVEEPVVDAPAVVEEVAAEAPPAETPAVEPLATEPVAAEASEADAVSAPVDLPGPVAATETEAPAPDDEIPVADTDTPAPVAPAREVAPETPTPAATAPAPPEAAVDVPMVHEVEQSAAAATEVAVEVVAAAPAADAPTEDAALKPAPAARRKVAAPAPPRPPLRRAEPPAPPRPPLRRAEPAPAPAANGTPAAEPSPTGTRRVPGSTPAEPGRGTDRDAGRGKRRRVIIDAQASRRGPGPQGRDRRGQKGGHRSDDREPAVTIPPSEMPQVDVRSGATIKEMAESLSIPATLIIKTLMGMGELATITQSLSDEEMEVVAAELERKIQIVHAEEEDEFAAIEEDAPESLVARAPVVTVMGHVDHGKTSLLDAIRQTEVVAGEAGGITQHIGAYQVRHHNRELTFLDTPGHEAFTAMRARGAKITDVAVIVVAADDGVMETTIEAIDHARAADVPFMVAINKIDKANANPDRVRQELSTHDVIPTSWGGTYEFVEVSAIERTGLDTLLETVLLVADADADPKANAGAVASGSVIESRLDPGRGPVCTLLVQRGTMRVGDVLLVGRTFGRVRAMHDYKGDVIDEAGPSVPVEVLGMDSVPDAGERFRAVENERVARQLAGQRSHRIRSEELANRRPVSLEDLFARVQEGLNQLNIIIKADVHGSVEALRDALEKIEQTEVKLRVIHTGVGAVTESDVNLAAASEAIVIAFNVRPRPEARMLAERVGVDVRNYRVIYRAIEDMRAALIGMLTPDIVEQALGTLEVRTTFRASRIGTIAGCYVTDGMARRNSNMRLVRDGTIVFEGKIGSLRRFNDDVREVAQGFECGVVIDGFNDVKDGDVIEAYELKEVARTEQAPATSEAGGSKG